MLFFVYARKRILSAVKAIESFVFCAAVATGMLQMISLNSRFFAKVADVKRLRRQYHSSHVSSGIVKW